MGSLRSRADWIRVEQRVGELEGGVLSGQALVDVLERVDLVLHHVLLGLLEVHLKMRNYWRIIRLFTFMSVLPSSLWRVRIPTTSAGKTMS